MKSIHQIVLPFITMDLFVIPYPLKSLEDLPDFELTIKVRKESEKSAGKENLAIWEPSPPLVLGLKFSNIGEAPPGGKNMGMVSQSAFGTLSDVEKTLLTESLKHYLTKNRPLCVAGDYYIVSETYELSTNALIRMLTAIQSGQQSSIKVPTFTFWKKDNGHVAVQLELPLGGGVVFHTRKETAQTPGGDDSFRGNFQFLGERRGFSITRPTNRYCFKKYVNEYLLKQSFDAAMKIFENVPQIQMNEVDYLNFVTPQLVCA
jgi:hypothetical protein